MLTEHYILAGCVYLLIAVGTFIVGWAQQDFTVDEARKVAGLSLLWPLILINLLYHFFKGDIKW